MPLFDREQTTLNRMLLAAVAFIAIGALVVSCDLSNDEERATTGLSIPMPTRDGYSASAYLDLPRVTSNRGWYGVWVMLLGQNSEGVPFIQAGLMRQEAEKAVPGVALAPFIAFRRRGQAITYVQLPPFKGNGKRCSHYFAVNRSGSTVSIRMDGKTVLSEPAREFMDAKEPMDVTFAAELFRYGDRASGIISDVELSPSPVSPLRPYNVQKVWGGRGVHIEHFARRFQAEGIFHRRGTN